MTIPQLLVFDFDGCLYPFTDDLIAELFRAIGETGHLLSDGEWDHDHAEKMGYESFMQTGLGYGRVCEEFNRALHEGFHYHHEFINLDLKPDPELIAAFEALDRNNVHVMILTQSNSIFLDRKLKILELDRFFSKNMRISHDQYNFQLKSEKPDGFVLAQSRARHVTGIDFRPENTWMFEDTSNNLRIPHEMGWNTVLVGQGDKEVELKEHIHHIFDTPSYVLQAMPQRLIMPAAPQII